MNGGPTRSVKTSQWEGGERYGDTHHDYYGEFRGTVTGTAPGDSVRVWFTGVKPGKGPAYAGKQVELSISYLTDWGTQGRQRGRGRRTTGPGPRRPSRRAPPPLTEDTVFTGFGAEGLTTAEMRRDFVARAMAHLLD